MPHGRRVQKGSFGSHFDDLVTQFSGVTLVRRAEAPSNRSRELQEKIDIHSRLFERAWRVDRDA